MRKVTIMAALASTTYLLIGCKCNPESPPSSFEGKSASKFIVMDFKVTSSDGAYSGTRTLNDGEVFEFSHAGEQYVLIYSHEANCIHAQRLTPPSSLQIEINNASLKWINVFPRGEANSTLAIRTLKSDSPNSSKNPRQP